MRRMKLDLWCYFVVSLIGFPTEPPRFHPNWVQRFYPNPARLHPSYRNTVIPYLVQRYTIYLQHQPSLVELDFSRKIASILQMNPNSTKTNFDYSITVIVFTIINKLHETNIVTLDNKVVRLKIYSVLVIKRQT